MSRVQLALNVSRLDEAITFYRKLFQTEPAKLRDGYANFAISDPPLKLVLLENPQQAGTLNHLGIEVETINEVSEATERLSAHELPLTVEEGVTCCHALQDKVWVAGADTRWEIYTVIDDAPQSVETCCHDSGDEKKSEVCCAA